MFILVDQDGTVYARGSRALCQARYASTLQMAVCFGVHGFKLFIKEVI